MAFSGYLYNSANIQPFSGHLGLPELLRCPDLDAIGTPFEYFNASQSPVFSSAPPSRWGRGMLPQRAPSSG